MLSSSPQSARRCLPPLVLLAGLNLPAFAQGTPTATAWPDHSRLLPAKLRGIPTGLTLTHSPGLVHPQPDPAQPGRYAWQHSTSVRADVADLQIVECGSFIWYDSTGWHANLHETPAEFAHLFACPAGQLRRGRTYTFQRNYRFASAGQLYGGDALWYVLARDAQGHLYKGWGVVETEPDASGR